MASVIYVLGTRNALHNSITGVVTACSEIPFTPSSNYLRVCAVFTVFLGHVNRGCNRFWALEEREGMYVIGRLYLGANSSLPIQIEVKCRNVLDH